MKLILYPLISNRYWWGQLWIRFSLFFYDWFYSLFVLIKDLVWLSYHFLILGFFYKAWFIWPIKKRTFKQKTLSVVSKHDQLLPPRTAWSFPWSQTTGSKQIVKAPQIPTFPYRLRIHKKKDMLLCQQPCAKYWNGPETQGKNMEKILRCWRLLHGSQRVR